MIRALKLEDEEYEQKMKEYKSKGWDYETSDDTVIAVNFGMEHKAMLGHVKMFFERENGYIAINPKFDCKK